MMHEGLVECQSCCRSAGLARWFWCAKILVGRLRHVGWGAGARGRMARIVGIQGIAQQVRGPEVLRAAWVPALRHGVVLSGVKPPGEITYDSARSAWASCRDHRFSVLCRTNDSGTVYIEHEDALLPSAARYRTRRTAIAFAASRLRSGKTLMVLLSRTWFRQRFVHFTADSIGWTRR